MGKVLGTENPSDLMTKHVDAKLLAEHCRCMGCEFAAGRAELAPQVVQEVEDSVNFVEDIPTGLMTESESQESTTDENHCARESELCLPLKSVVRRLGDDHCRGGDEAKGTSFNRQREYNQVDRDHSLGIQAGEHLRGHPYFSFILPFGRSRSRGGAYFSAVCPCRLSLCVNERLHLCTCDVHRFSVLP